MEQPAKLRPSEVRVFEESEKRKKADARRLRELEVEIAQRQRKQVALIIAAFVVMALAVVVGLVLRGFFYISLLDAIKAGGVLCVSL